MVISTQLQNRLNLLMVDTQTKYNLETIMPVLDEEIDSIIENFFRHLTSFPQTEKIFKSRTQIAALKYSQKKHWMMLFSCRFDEKYVASAIRVGKVHFQQSVAPYLYIAGYSFFHGAVIKAIVARQAYANELSNILPAVAQVIYLDMDLSLSVYTREFWRPMAPDQTSHWLVG